jgi:glycosyltransferase involved in cell wall biosynthesis
VVGDGPDLEQLQRAYPDVLFTGARFGRELASYVAAADVFVFPSRTDTFGLVLLEAMACGVPVAAYPVTGPADVVMDGITGCLSENLAEAVKNALKIDSRACLEYARQNSWLASSEVFASYMYDNTENSDWPGREQTVRWG